MVTVVGVKLSVANAAGLPEMYGITAASSLVAAECAMQEGLEGVLGEGLFLGLRYIN